MSPSSGRHPAYRAKRLPELPLILRRLKAMSLHQIQRVRHELRRRTLTVAAIEELSTRMMRFRFTSPDLHDFTSASPDDHVKLFFPAADASSNDKPPMRDFTPRAFDREKGTLTIDFAIHEAGPAMEWARQAKVGGTLQIGGPRGSAVIPDDFDWYLLIGDDTALPAIGRRVEELRAGVPVTTFVIMHGDGAGINLSTDAAWTATWLTRGPSDDAAALLNALAGYELPAGDGFVWIAAEASVAQAIKRYIVEERGQPREWVKASGYWMRGEADAHVKIED